MGAFRTWVENSLIKPLEAKLDELKTAIGNINLNTEGLTDLFDPIIKLKESIDKYIEGKGYEKYILWLNQCNDIQALDNVYAEAQRWKRDDPSIKGAYEIRKAELTAQGAITHTDLALGLVGTGIKKGVDAITKNAYANLKPTIEKLLDQHPELKEQKADIMSIASSGEFGLNAVISFLLGNFLSPVIQASLAPVWMKVAQEVNKGIRSELLGPGELIPAEWRAFLTKADVDEELKKRGLTDKDIEALKKVLRFYPGPADFIRFAVRDVFAPEIVKKYGYDELFPSDIVPYAGKAGVDQDILTWFWRAHWELPSPSQGFEMLHRASKDPYYSGQTPAGTYEGANYYTVIDRTDLVNLLKVADVAPYWIDRLINVSYNNVTRVDLRRLYQGGQYTKQDVFLGNLSNGYTPAMAAAITEWVIDNYSPEERDLTKAEILKNYAIGEVSRETVSELLKGLEYTEAQIAWLLTYEDYKAAKEDKIAEAEVLLAELVNGTKTLEAFKKALEAIGLTQKQINTYTAKGLREIRSGIKLPEVSRVCSWLKAGLITEAKFKEYMLELKYRPADILTYIKEYSPGEEEEAPEEEEV
jgi:hypothetical protein